MSTETAYQPTGFSPSGEAADSLHRRLDGASLLVTGGTGSFGRAFVRRVFEAARPSRLVVFSRDEMKQYEMQQDPFLAGRDEMRYFIGDVRDRPRLEMAMRDVDYVIHAAALKHITAAEYNPFEYVHTNILGAENVVHAAMTNRVKRVIALSTDKAANPINLYGATKLASDKIFVAGNNIRGSTGVRFSVVRYGNVLGSRGSVVPFFRRLIAEGAKSLPVTDARMTRFWITLREGVDFVLSCLDRMHAAEIFVPKLPSMRIVDLATCLAPDLPHDIIGIRPGEKLHEVMITPEEGRNTIELPDRYVVLPEIKFWDLKEPDHAGTPVPGGFSYASDSNDRWLDIEGMRAVLEENDL